MLLDCFDNMPELVQFLFELLYHLNQFYLLEHLHPYFLLQFLFHFVMQEIAYQLLDLYLFFYLP
ncbi:MAG: hypothetical protein CBC05_09105 [Crocinitomicaceae bacterium TMED45]|nr:MAG: hypothetical protein CBC05_09105 [Crocinitomicaceae bacterium TMED45]